MGKHSELNAAFKSLHKEFKSKVNQQVKPLLEKLLVSLLTDELPEIKIDMDIEDGEECYIEDCSVKIAAIQKGATKNIKFEVNEYVYVDELKESAVIKEINGNKLKIYFSKIDTYAEVPKEYVSKLEGADEPDVDQEGFTDFSEVGEDLYDAAEKINDAVREIDHNILRSLFNGEITLIVTGRGIKVRK